MSRSLAECCTAVRCRRRVQIARDHHPPRIRVDIPRCSKIPRADNGDMQVATSRRTTNARRSRLESRQCRPPGVSVVRDCWLSAGAARASNRLTPGILDSLASFMHLSISALATERQLAHPSPLLVASEQQITTSSSSVRDHLRLRSQAPIELSSRNCPSR